MNFQFACANFFLFTHITVTIHLHGKAITMDALASKCLQILEKHGLNKH